MKSGFTLIELLVVIAIIGVLSAIILPQVNIAREKSRIVKAQAEIQQIESAVARLSLDTNEWPGHQNVDCVNGSAANEIWDLSTQSAGITQDDTGIPYSNWDGPYMASMPLDPWGNNYFMDSDYSVDSTTKKPCNGAGVCSDVVVIGSFGPDGSGQNVYNSDDIINIVSENLVCP